MRYENYKIDITFSVIHPSIMEYDRKKVVVTITLGKQYEVENGESIPNDGFNLDDLNKAKHYFDSIGCDTQIVHLNKYLHDNIKTDDAYVLMVKQALQKMIGDRLDKLYDEQLNLNVNTKGLFYGKVLNLKSRQYICIRKNSRIPDYENGISRHLSFEDTPLLNEIKTMLGDNIIPEFVDYDVENNYYSNAARCGLGFHGDTGRNKIMGIRMGQPFPLFFQWYVKRQSISPYIKLMFEHGDIYMMSDKATGHDWKVTSDPYLKHAAGYEKYLKINN